MSSSNLLKKLRAVPSLSSGDCQLLVESVSDYAIFILDTEGRVASWNAGAERIKGYAADEIVGQHVSVFYPPEDVAAGKPDRMLGAARERGRVADEGWRVRKDGSLFWANVVITALWDEEGVLRGFGKVTQDVTSRRAAEESLRRSEQRFHSLVDSITDYAVFMLDPSGRVATWNRGAEKVKGYTAKEIVGQHFSAFYTPEDRAARKPDRILDIVAREGRFEDDSWRVRKDGSLFWANVVITALRDDDGNLAGFAKVTRDLTERRRVDEALRQSEERLRLLIEGVSDYAIYMLDLEGRVTTWNLGAERMKGYRASEIIGRHFSLFFPAEDVKAGKPVRELEVARSEGRFEDEGWRVRRDGSRFWANVVVAAIYDSQGRQVGFGKVTRDLTARHQAEEAERKALVERMAREAAEASEAATRRAAERANEAAARANEANRIKDEFLAIVSHELRTPLNAILGYSSLLRQRPPEAAMLAKGLDAIHRNAEAQAKLIDDILDVSRIITGKLRLELRPIDLVATVNEAIDVIRPSAAAKKIALDVQVLTDAPVLEADRDRIRQIVWNLLSNAVKFTDAGGSVVVTIDQVASHLRMSVRDSGRGIAPEFLPFVFDRFRQADSSTTRQLGGLGLGLSIVKQLVELHGGQVDVESAGLGRGSLFRVVLPAQATAPRPPKEEPRPVEAPPEPPPGTFDLSDLRVLVVDDDDDARSLVAEFLRGAGALVETAASAASGLAAIEAFRPDVLVSDIGMPGEDGFSFIRRVRALGPSRGGTLPAVALTAYTRSQDRTKALAAGFTSHVGKPVDPADLLAAVGNLAALVKR